MQPRPRDRLGRLLPPGSVGVPPLTEDLPDSPHAILQVAQDLLDDGRYFQAHEVLEDAWKTALGAERGLWRGLTQIVVGLVHAARGNSRGAVALLRRGLTELDPHLRAPEIGWTRDLDLPGVARWAAAELSRLEKGCRPEAGLRPPRLLRP